MSREETTRPLHAHIAVCICTCRRPQGLASLLAALCRQTFETAPPPVVSIIVADNEVNPLNREICSKAGEECPHPVQYLEARPPGISFARNACLDHLPAGCTHVAMIDDDEIPAENWLDTLLQAHQQTGADIVVGPTLAVFEADTPEWLIQSGWYDKPPNPERYSNLQPFPPAATCNVLLKSSIFSAEGFRFDPKLALSGSEDKLLFQDLKLRGHSIVWAAGAVAREYVPPHRARLAYALSEAVRRGSTRFYVKNRLKATGGMKRGKLVLRSTARALSGIGSHSLRAILLLPLPARNRHKLARHLLGTAENIGFLAGIFGYRRKHYQPRSPS